MKLNNKGLTLIELLISIALVSIVMGFMFKLLSDAQDARTNNNFAIENQINRNEIIKTIQNDLTKYKVTDITNQGNTIIIDIDKDSINDFYKDDFQITNLDNLDVLINNNSDLFKIVLSDNTISYKTIEKGISEDNDKKTILTVINKKWTAKECTYGNIQISNSSDNDIINIRIPVYTTNSNNTIDNNNIMDDIVIDYVEGSNTDDDGIVYSYWNDDYNINLYTIGQFPDGKTYDSISALANKDSEFLRKRVFIRSTDTKHEACLYYNEKEFCLGPDYWDTDATKTLNILESNMNKKLATEGDCKIYGNHVYCMYGDYFECDANNDGSVFCKSNFITKSCYVYQNGNATCF